MCARGDKVYNICGNCQNYNCKQPSTPGTTSEIEVLPDTTRMQHEPDENITGVSSSCDQYLWR